MEHRRIIPDFNLFGETSAFPDVVHCERIVDRARLHDWTIAPHRHREMVQVFLMRRGAALARVDGREHALKDGDFLYIPRLAVHGFAFRRGAEGLVLSVPSPIVQLIGTGSAEIAASLGRPIVGPSGEALGRLSLQLAEAFASHGTYRAQLLAALAQALLASVAEIGAQAVAQEPSAAHRRMLAFDALLARHLAAGWRAADFARALAITPGHLNRLCRAATGQSASRYIEGAVMTEASRLLAFTQLPVAEIGYRLAFDDPAYFSRRFRAVRGLTPSDYRAQFSG